MARINLMDLNIEDFVKNVRVLVVDESEKEREVICSALESYGFKSDNLYCCHDIDEAEEFIDLVQVIFLEASEKRCKAVGGYDMYGVLAKWKDLGKDVFISAYRRDLGKFTRTSALWSEQFIPKPLNSVTLLSALDLWAEITVLDLLIYDTRGIIHNREEEGQNEPTREVYE